jgi:hypothetical protein
VSPIGREKAEMQKRGEETLQNEREKGKSREHGHGDLRSEWGKTRIYAFNTVFETV